MKILLFIPLLMLFAVLSVPGVVSHSSPSPFVAEVASSTKPGTPQPSVATTTQKKTVPVKKKPVPQEKTQEQPVAPLTPQATSTASTERPSSPTETPDATRIATIEAEIVRLTNVERAKENLSSLSVDSTLRQVAWGHSADMLANNYFDHDNLNGCSSSCRATNAGYRWKAIGENIYMMSGFKLSAEKTAAMIVDGWMNSPGHRANILSASFAESGVGVITDGESIYATAMYGKER
jgi:uncharacterized protein YkwD